MSETHKTRGSARFERNPGLETGPECDGPLAAGGGEPLVVGGPPSDKSTSPGPIPPVILGRYHLLRKLGEGGPGEVFEAEDTALRRRVAIKLLRAPRPGGAAAVSNLVDEARAAASVRHPGIATISEVGEFDGRAYLAMELVEGESLRHRLAGGPAEVDEIVRIGLQAAEALACAHGAGLVHCDIKPSNLLLDRGGAVKIVDFGLARRLGVYPHDELGDVSAEVAGTLGYMSPEQLRAEALDPRTDLFSLGVVLYELATGRRPFADVAAVLGRQPIPVAALRPDIPAGLERLIRKALEKDRDARYGSASAMAADLAELREASSRRVAADKAQEAARAYRPARQREGRMLALRRRRRLVASGWASSAIAITGALVGGLGVPIAAVAAALAIVSFTSAARSVAPASTSRDGEGIAFRGLLPFSEADRGAFFGRDNEIAALTALVTNPDLRLGVVLGDSGAGKTSLLRAGVIPRLWEAGVLPLYCRSYREPLAGILDAGQAQAGLPADPGEDVEGFIRRLARDTAGGVILILDQLEEFFVSRTVDADREPLLGLVARLVNDQNVSAKVLLCLRSDFLHHVGAAFDGRVHEPLAAARRFLLRPLEVRRAAEVIERAAAAGGLAFESGLATQLAGDLAADGKVLPSELQIVGDQMQRRGILTLKEYRRTGGKSALLHAYLEDVVKSSGDEAAAGFVLRALISDENTRATATAAEISRRAERSRRVVEDLLQLFVGCRLVRVLQDEEPWRYELVHDYLVERINQITGSVLSAQQRAVRMLRQFVSHDAIDPGVRIPVLDLLFIVRHGLGSADAKGRVLIRRSAIRGAARALAFLVVGAAIVTAVAGVASVRSEWRETILRDGHRAAARRIAFSPDGRTLISVGEDGRVIAWDFPRREVRAVLEERPAWFESLAISPDRKWIAAGGVGGAVSIWAADTFAKVATLTTFGTSVRELVFSADGRVLLAAPQDVPPGLVAFECGTWRRLWQREKGMSWPALLANPRAPEFVTSTGLEVLAEDTGQELSSFSKTAGGNALAFYASGDGVVGVGSEGEVCFYDRPTRRTVKHELVFRDHGKAAAVSPDQSWAATGAEDIVLWDLRTLRQTQRLPCASVVWGLAFSPDGTALVSSHGDGSILVWDVSRREVVANLSGHHGAVRRVAFSPVGDLLASAGEDGSVVLWQLKEGRKAGVLLGTGQRITGLAFDGAGRTLASSEQLGSTILWDLASRTRKEVFDRVRSYDLAMTRDARVIATSDGILASGRAGRVMVLPLTELSAYGIAISHDDSLFAYGFESSRVMLFSTRTSETLAAAAAPSGGSVQALAFSPDDSYLVSGDAKCEVWLWQVNPLRPLRRVGRHLARVQSVAFSPDGRMVVSAGDDHAVVIWDAHSGEELSRIGAQNVPVHSAVFSPDSRAIAAGTYDGAVRYFRLHRTLWGRDLETWRWP